MFLLRNPKKYPSYKGLTHLSKTKRCELVLAAQHRYRRGDRFDRIGKEEWPFPATHTHLLFPPQYRTNAADPQVCFYLTKVFSQSPSNL